MIVDFTYYTDVFRGATSAFDASSFSDVERRAETKLNYITAGKSSKLTEYPAEVKDCVCALCDALYAIDSVKSCIRENNGNIVSSMSSLGVSVSYSSGDVTELKKAAMSLGGENIYMKKIATEYLMGSGLLYVGF